MSSSIPAALANFMALMDPRQGGALPPGTQVIFQKYLPRYIAPVTLQINEVHGQQMPAELGPSYKREETYDLHCCLACVAGDNNYLAAFQAVFANFATIEITVANNPTLPAVAGSATPGPVRFAQTIQLDFVPDADTKGFVVGELTFTVHCEARVTSLT